VDRELADIGKRIKICREDDLAVHEAHKAAALVPAREVLDRIGIYETRLRRQFNTALTQLERLQRARRSREADPGSSPERGLDSSTAENTQTKKRTQSPPVNPAALSSTSPSEENGPAEKTNQKCPPSLENEIVRLLDTLGEGESQRSETEKTNPSVDLQSVDLTPGSNNLAPVYRALP
jgi:hypothetical protein